MIGQLARAPALSLALFFQSHRFCYLVSLMVVAALIDTDCQVRSVHQEGVKQLIHEFGKKCFYKCIDISAYSLFDLFFLQSLHHFFFILFMALSSPTVQEGDTDMLPSQGGPRRGGATPPTKIGWQRNHYNKFFNPCMFFAAVHSAFTLNYSASIHSGFVRFREWLIIQPAFS
jgi:hypothetical protein